MLKVELANIGLELRELLLRLQKTDSKLEQGINSNFVIVSRESFGPSSELIRTIRDYHPARIFSLVFEEDRTEIQAAVSVLTGEVLKGSYSCTDLIELKLGLCQVREALSLMYANFLSGRQTEMFVHDWGVIGPEFETILAAADLLIFDSAYLTSDEDWKLKLLLSEGANVLDCEWLRMVPWRSVSRTAVRKLDSSDLACSVDSIQIEGNLDESPQVILLAAWFAKVFGAEIRGVGFNGLECGSTDTNFTMKILNMVGAAISRVLISCGENPSIEILRKGDELVLKSNVLGEFSETCQILDNNSNALLKYFYTIGDASSNLGEVWSLALEISALKAEFASS